MRMKKKIISSLLIFSILLSIFAPIVSNSYTIDEGVRFSLGSDATQLVAGTQITVSMYIELESGKSVDTFSGFLKYDTSVLEFNTDEEFLTSTQTKWNATDYVDNNGLIQIESTRSNSNSAKSGLMYTMVFNVLKTTESTEISLEEPINCAYLGVDIWCEGTTLKIPDVPDVYTITYNANTTDKVDNMPSVGNKVEGIDYTIATTPVRTGYTFTGWNTKSDGTGTTYAAGSTYTTDEDLELYAQWQIITTTLTINPNGGVWEGSSATQTFTQGYGTTKAISDPTTAPNGYMVKFNANGGQADFLQATQTTTFNEWILTGGGKLDRTTYTFGDTTATLTANYKGNSITLPDATKVGATFKGWYTASTGGTKIGGAGETYTPGSNITLFAQWNEMEYTLTINPDGGIYNGNTTVTGGYDSTVAITNPTAPNGYTITLNKNDGTGTTTQLIQTKTFDKWILTGKGSLNGIVYTFGNGDGQLTATYISNSVELETPTREGYTFDGWYTLQSGGTKIESPYMPSSDITLYVHWTPKTYEITFNPGEDGTVNPTSKTVTYDEIYGTLPMPTRPGYDFDRWEDTNGNEVKATNTVKITEDTTLTARWLGAEYTVTFDPNGGQIDTPSKTVRNEGTYGTLPTPTKPGYIFKGWINPNGEKITSTTTVNLTADEILTADWEANTYTITFDPGPDGTVNEPTRDVNYGDTYGTLPIPTRPGYVFDGWYGPDGNKIEETDVIDILTDITVTAGWVGEEYTLTFDYEGGTGSESSRTIQNGLAYGTLPIANKTGYTFKGWFNSDGQEVKGIEIVNTTSDITLYAKYDINEYRVTFKNDDGTIIKTIDVEYGKNAQYTGATPVKSNVQKGYEATFSGWQDASKLSNITENVTVTATYTISPKVYTITYNNLKNSDNSANPTTYTIEDPNITLVDLPNQGKYIFKGWYTSNDETGTKVTSIDTSKLGNIILHAQWENDSLYFKSEKYKVGENDIDNYENGDIYLDKIEPETTLSEFINNCDTNGTITVINEKGQTLSSDDLVGTTMTIKVTRYDEEITMTIVVMGDINGDGKNTAQDLSELNSACLGISEVELTGARFKAADIDDNRRITVTDLAELNNALLGISKLTYNKPNKQ